MATQQSTASSPIALPRWQVLLLLVGFPALYLVNSFTPWSMGLFVDHDRSYYLPFWTSVAVLHWTSFVLALVFIRRAGGRLSDIGFKLRSSGAVAVTGFIVAAGVALILIRQTWPASTAPYSDWQVLYPSTITERLFWIFICVTAGFCEELVYRGYGIRVLQLRGFRTWQAVVLATTSFVFIHGLAGVFLFPCYFMAGLLLAMILLWRKSLTAGICIHAAFDLMALLAI